MVRKADRDKPPVALWATLRRRERRWEASEVLDRLRAANQPVSASYLYAIEGGSKKPSPHVLAALEAIYGDTAPDSTKEPRPEWAEALGETVDSIQKTVQSIAVDQAAVLAVLEAREAHAQQPPGDQEDGPGPSQSEQQRGR